MGEKIISLAEGLDDDSMRVEGHLVLGYNLAFTKDLSLGLDEIEKGIKYFHPDRYRSTRFRLGNNPGVASFTASALFLWMLGFPDRALKRANEAIELAKTLNHPYSMAYAIFHTSLIHLWRGEAELVEYRAQQVLEIAKEHEFLVWGAVATCLQGAALARMDRAEEGLAQVRWGMHLYQGLKTPPIFWPLLLYIQAGVCGQGGKPEEGLALLDEAMEIARHWSGRSMMPEFLRLKGDLLLANSEENAAEAETWLQLSLEVARELRAKMMELRAAISMCRLWQGQGKAEEGRRMLSTVYEKFTEGFTTADLMEAKDLLRMNGQPAGDDDPGA
jgi:ATP/maltotriose-dependent transcriptional regulator MalT